MRYIAEKKALSKINKLKEELKDIVRERYEHRAKNCLTCETQGICCLDAHFVNVRITRLEATAIRNVLAQLPEDRRLTIFERIGQTIETYGLNDNTSAEKTFACPLFERGIGCLVHQEGKPFPCIVHACYENRKDLPPDMLLEWHEDAAATLDRKTYGSGASRSPLPLAVSKVMNPV